MYDNVIMCGMSYTLTDDEVTDLVALFGEHPFLAILEDGTQKDRSRRAERRKTTAHKHQRLEKIASYYPSKDSDKHNLKKRCRESKAWYTYDDLRKDTEADELAEAWKVATYLNQRQQFFKVVDQWQLHDVNEDGDCITYQGKEYYIDGCWYGFYLDNLGAHYYL